MTMVTGTSERDTARLAAVVRERIGLSTRVPAEFFEARADAVAAACLAMARRFAAGGRLLVFGEGACATDAQHVAVEFVHPVIVGKRALPAIALTADGAAASFQRLLGTLGRPEDIALGVSDGECPPAVRTTLDAARATGMLTIAVAGGTTGALPRAAHVFRVAADDRMVIQEVQETLYHVLWELVHVFFEHGVT